MDSTPSSSRIFFPSFSAASCVSAWTRTLSADVRFSVVSSLCGILRGEAKA